MPQAPKKPYTPRDLRDAALRFKVLGNVTRLGIVGELAKGSLNAGAMTPLTGMTQPAGGHHLRLLCASKIVETTRDGHALIYSLTDLGRAHWGALEKLFV